MAKTIKMEKDIKLDDKIIQSQQGLSRDLGNVIKTEKSKVTIITADNATKVKHVETVHCGRGGKVSAIKTYLKAMDKNNKRLYSS